VRRLSKLIFVAPPLVGRGVPGADSYACPKDNASPLITLLTVVTVVDRDDRVVVAVVYVLRAGGWLSSRSPSAAHTKLPAFAVSPTPLYVGNAG
jgi:hypothetical protein